MTSTNVARISHKDCGHCPDCTVKITCLRSVSPKHPSRGCERALRGFISTRGGLTQGVSELLQSADCSRACVKRGREKSAQVMRETECIDQEGIGSRRCARARMRERLLAHLRCGNAADEFEIDQCLAVATRPIHKAVADSPSGIIPGSSSASFACGRRPSFREDGHRCL